MVLIISDVGNVTKGQGVPDHQMDPLVMPSILKKFASCFGGFCRCVVC